MIKKRTASVFLIICLVLSAVVIVSGAEIFQARQASPAQNSQEPYFILWDADFDISDLDNTSPYDVPLILSDATIEVDDWDFSATAFSPDEPYFVLWDADFDVSGLDNTSPYDVPLILSNATIEAEDWDFSVAAFSPGEPYFILWDANFDVSGLDNTSPYDVPLILSDATIEAEDWDFSATAFSPGEPYFILWDADFDVSGLDNTSPYDVPIILLSYSEIMPFSTSQGTVRSLSISFSNNSVVAGNVSVNVTFDNATGKIVSILNPAGAFNNASWTFNNQNNHHGPVSNAKITDGSGTIFGSMRFNAHVDVILGRNHSNAGVSVRLTGSGTGNI